MELVGSDLFVTHLNLAVGANFGKRVKQYLVLNVLLLDNPI